jgi:hypothetical protein
LPSLHLFQRVHHRGRAGGSDIAGERISNLAHKSKTMAQRSKFNA